MSGWGLLQEISNYVHDLFGNQTLRTTEASNIFGDIRIPVSLGLVPGIDIVRVSGFNTDVDNAQAEDIIFQGGKYPFLSVAETIDFSSTSVNDTVLGTGARSILVQGVNSTFDQISETIITDGLTIVSTVNQYRGAINTTVTSAGALGFNDGIISAVSQVSASLVSTISQNVASEGFNRSFDTVYTVPNGKTAIIVQVSAAISKRIGGSGSKEGGVTIEIRDPALGIFIGGSATTARSDGTGFAISETTYPVSVPQKNDIKGTCFGLANNCRFTMSISMLLLDNETFGLS